MLQLPGLPDGTTDVALNVTVTRPTARGHVTAWPTGSAKPGTSNVNVEAGQTQANEVISRVGSGGRVSLWVDSMAADLVVDLVGAVFPRGDTVQALAQPQRVLDTRRGGGRRSGELTLALPAGVVPASATGVVLNVTATGASSRGFVAVYPAGAANPGTSSVNFVPGMDQANEVLTPLRGGRVTLLVDGIGRPSTHLVVDVVGWLGEV